MQFKSNIQISKNEYLNTYNIFKKGYIAFEGHKSKEFRFGRFVENDIGDGIVSHIFIVFRPIMEFDINFWKYAINNELIMQSILSRATKASTMMNDLVVKDFLKEIFFVPSVGEQACIGKTLKYLDHLITLHQRKLEKLKIIKKSMLENLFPQNGEKTPKIRFSGFTEDWEQRKLGEIVVIERGGSPRPIEKYVTESNDGLNWIKIGDAPVQGRYITKTSEKIKESGLSKTRQVFPGDLILSNSMSFGKPYIMGIEGCIHDGWLVIKNKNNVFDLKFLCHMLSTEYLFNQYKMFAAGSTVNNLNKELVGNASVRFPKMLEQKKIGQYLESLDHLITLHQSKSFGHILEVIVSCTLYWEQRKLGEYLIQYTEVTIINDQYPVLTSSRKGIFFQKDYYDGNQIASENNIGYNIVPYGYFTYRHMSDDEIFYFNINNIIDNGIVSTLYPVFTTNNRLDSKFLQYELNFGKEFRKYSVLQKQGGSRTYMYFNKLRDLKLTITTSLKEQECIKNLICSIDHLITLHQFEPFQLIFKAIAYRIIDYTKSKPPSHRK